MRLGDTTAIDMSTGFLLQKTSSAQDAERSFSAGDPIAN